MYELEPPLYARPPHRIALTTAESQLPQFVQPPPEGVSWAAHLKFTEPVVDTSAPPREIPPRRPLTEEPVKVNFQSRRAVLEKIYEMSDSEDELILKQGYCMAQNFRPEERVKFAFEL